MSKVKLIYIFPDVNLLCNRCQRGEVWFTCFGHVLARKTRERRLPKLAKHFYFEPDPLVTVFGTPWDDEMRLTPNKSHTTSFTSLLPRRAVLLRWRDAAPPTHAQWLRDAKSCLDLEKIHYTRCNSRSLATFPEILLKSALIVKSLFLSPLLECIGQASPNTSVLLHSLVFRKSVVSEYISTFTGSPPKSVSPRLTM